MRDVVMPGIGLYRIQAARTGEHVGTDEPVFGPLIDLRCGDQTIQVPEWCRVTVYRLKGGQPRAFTATEYWLENYATASKKTADPNAMWKKRSRGQLAKCAEAQALRKGFPEVGSQPTAEEMEGKGYDFDMDAAGAVTPTPAPPPARPTLEAYPQERFDANLADWTKVITTGRKSTDDLIAMLSTKGVLSEAQQATLRRIKPATDASPIDGQPAEVTQ
jgi:hypothetical protein